MLRKMRATMLILPLLLALALLPFARTAPVSDTDDLAQVIGETAPFLPSSEPANDGPGPNLVPRAPKKTKTKTRSKTRTRSRPKTKTKTRTKSRTSTRTRSSTTKSSSTVKTTTKLGVLVKSVTSTSKTMSSSSISLSRTATATRTASLTKTASLSTMSNSNTRSLTHISSSATATATATRSSTTLSRTTSSLSNSKSTSATATPTTTVSSLFPARLFPGSPTADPDGMDAQILTTSSGTSLFAGVYVSESSAGYPIDLGNASTYYLDISNPSYNSFLMSMDSKGYINWIFTMSSTSGFRIAGSKDGMCLSSDENYLFVGGSSLSSSVTVHGTSVSRPAGSTAWILLLKIAVSDGSVVWTKAIGSGGSGVTGANLFALECDAAGAFYIGGNVMNGTSGAFDLGNNVTLSTTDSSFGDLFIAKIGSDGTTAWAQSYGSSGVVEQVSTLAYDSAADDIVVAGTYDGGGFTLGTTDLPAGKLFFGRFSSAGVPRTNAAGYATSTSFNINFGKLIVGNTSNETYLMLSFQGTLKVNGSSSTVLNATSKGNWEVGIVQLSNLMQPTSIWSIGGTSEDFPQTLGQDANGNIYAMMKTYSTTVYRSDTGSSFSCADGTYGTLMIAKITSGSIASIACPVNATAAEWWPGDYIGLDASGSLFAAGVVKPPSSSVTIGSKNVAVNALTETFYALKLSASSLALIE